jgi:hypothetical protein
MATEPLRIRISSPLAAGAAAQELQESIRLAAPGVRVDRERDDTEAQDAGAILAIILSATAVEVVARGVQAWLEHRTRSSVTFRYRAKEFKADNLTCKDAAELAKGIIALMGDAASSKGK